MEENIVVTLFTNSETAAVSEFQRTVSQFVSELISKHTELVGRNHNPRIRLSVRVCVTKRPHLTHYPQANTLSAG